MINNPYVPEVDKFENSHEFKYLANHFDKHGYYCSIPEGTEDYIKFWKQVRQYCLYGFTNSKGIKITGSHFFYLNFCRILAESKEEGTRKRKIYKFPEFVDLDYEYFWMVEYCKSNEKFLIATKGRRQGWSYKGAAIVTVEYTFYKDSRSIIGAFLSAYSEGTMKMVKEFLNHISTHTPFGHIRNPDLTDYFMAQYQEDIGGIKVWKGYKSSVETITFKDKATAAVGKSASIMLLDEAGVFPNIIQSWGYSEPLLKDGANFTGIAIVYGSAGEMEGGTQYFYEMFINPSMYNMLEFPDPENPAKKIGYFSSSTKGRWGVCRNPKSSWFKQPMVDENGNSNEEAAYDDLMFEREQARLASNPKKLHLTITQYPVNWKEAFLRNKGAIFASPEMLEWLGQLETTPSLYNQVEKGELVWVDGKLEFRPKDTLNYITDFPLKAEDDNTGCIAIWERPETISNENKEIPYSLYIAGCDPYDMDKSSSGSLGSFFIYKRFYRAGSTHDMIVAEYTGRPKFAEDFYENCRRLCIYYNAKVLYENQLKGMKNYFLQKNSLHLMWEQPDHMIKDIIKDSKVQRGYGVHMNRGSNGNSGIKDMCELYLKDWLYTERDDIEGNKIFNFHTIKSIALLKELIAYDIEGNYDRAIALMLCILQTKELHKVHVDNMTNSSNSWGNDPFLKKMWDRNKQFSQFKFN